MNSYFMGLRWLIKQSMILFKLKKVTQKKSILGRSISHYLCQLRLGICSTIHGLNIPTLVLYYIVSPLKCMTGWFVSCAKFSDSCAVHGTQRIFCVLFILHLQTTFDKRHLPAQRRCSGVFIVNFEGISQLFLVFLLLTLSK